MINRRAVLLVSGLFLGPLIGGSFQVHAETFRLVDSTGKAMESMVVYLQPKQADNTEAMSGDNQSAPLEIHQENKQFTPYITVIQKGYELQFVNDDDITHHIYSAVGPNRFSFKLRKGNATQSMVFDQTGHISMGCNIHDWMSGHLLVVDTPYFGTTDDAGWVSFDNVPDADYRLVIWHPQLSADKNSVSQGVVLPLAEALTITVSAPMAEIPSQESLDDFEFLEGY
ncbi:hypothetical protein FM038_008610 [Shewanella eurypsychrophilus]|uniref:Methylamine utilization protein n=1 Tax=Shewanella eurypsychrophilus TaxID=2593656 RepID=A0ABX6V4B0_9GAMM|nr:MULTISPECIES: hypothetical protein [Shewanella]QFU22209.1 hypothetical protein FS418_10190 [Shewanella sp. YLB-09]QPG57495.1 hypothetical protein FM038_008610 [Shewanella eurypsychrophilus]